MAAKKRGKSSTVTGTGPSGLPGKRTPVSIKKSDETWNQVTLSDGAVIRTRHIFFEINRVEGQFGSDGQPVYEFKGGTMLDVNAPAKLRKKK